MASSSSSWATKLETRLSALGDGASKETIQSLAKWIGFNRKHCSSFCTCLDKHLSQDGATRSWLYLQLVHEVMLLEKDNPMKCDRLNETRIMLGEMVVMPALRKSDVAMKQKVAPLVEEWEKADSFGSPTLINQMRNLLSSDIANEESKEDKSTAMVPAEPKEEPKAPNEEPKTEATEPAPKEVKEEAKPKVEPNKPASSPPPSLNRQSSVEEVTFDFEGSGIPYSKVESREFEGPCKDIANLQISRDLRNDATVQLSSRLSALPEEIKQACQEAQEMQNEDGTALVLPEEQALKFAGLIGDDILDADLDEALLNVETFMEMVQQQKQARQLLIQLLIQSRCQFGSDEAAEEFYSLDGVLKNLKERKQLLSDAMDLEGLDFEAEESKEEKKQQAAAAALAPLTWYKPNEPDSKRAKLE